MPLEALHRHPQGTSCHDSLLKVRVMQESGKIFEKA